MTTRDEITLRTPDALLNGEGVVSVISSCCPAIRDLWAIPNPDVDAILVAIRIASYGNEMDVDSNCPHCAASSRHSIDLNEMMDRFRVSNYDQILNVDGINIKLKPQSYRQTNRNNMIMFEEERLLITLSSEDINDDVRQQQFDMHMGRLLELNLDLLTSSTDWIQAADTERVVDPQFIKEFYANSAAQITRTVKARLDAMGEEMALPKVGVQCEECEKQYELSVEFNYSSFFAQGS
jgi:hypothetical protein